MFLKYSLKPFSPHLTIYKIQFSSFFSIVHRISIILFIFYIIFLFLYNIFLYNIFLYTILIFPSFFFFSFNFIYFFVIIFSLFHFLNGLKIILFKLNFY